MKAFIRAVDRFCATHPRFGIPRLIKILVIGMAVTFAINLIDPNGIFLIYTLFSPALILAGEVWRVISWVICPIDQLLLSPNVSNIVITAITLYFYYFIGSSLEQEWGTPKFTIFYSSGVLLNIIYGFAVWFLFGRSLFVTTAFINLSMILSFAVIYPNHTIMAFMVIPVKMKWLALLDAAVMVAYVIRSALAGDYVTALFPVVALLNFFLFSGYDLISHFTGGGPKQSKQAINFKKAAKKARREVETKTYRHKCAVCGKTDVSSPGMEFRYCSRCEGYHCFCAEHINKHTHFK